jgi:hypothetical protein
VESEVEAPEMWFAQEHTAKIDVFFFLLIHFEIMPGLLTLGKTVP